MEQQPHWSERAKMGLPPMPPSPAPPKPRAPRGSRGKLLVIALGLVVVIVAAVAAFLLVTSPKGTATASVVPVAKDTATPTSLLAAPSSSSTSSTTVGPRMAVYEDPTLGFSLQYPTGWQKFPMAGVTGTNVPPTDGFAVGDPDAAHFGTTPANYLVFAADKGTPVKESMVSALQKRAAQWVAQAPPDFKPTIAAPAAPIKVNGVGGASIIMTYLAQGHPMRMRICLLASGNFAYVFMFNAEEPNWQKYSRLFAATLNSLKVKTVTSS